MPLVPLKLPPGVHRNGTNYESSGRYWDASLVRFFEGTIRPVGGWRKLDQAQVALSGKARGIHSWRSVTSKYLAVGTHSKLYASQDGGSFDDITPGGYTVGRPDSYPGSGYGFGDYGVDNYNESQTGSTTLDATTWSLDNWGDYLVACATTDGNIYQWTGSGSAAVLSAAPTNNRLILVTPERHLVAFGADGDPRKIAWSSQENNNLWTASSTNTAGDLQLQTQGRIIAAKKVRGQTLILTDQDAHLMTYRGLPYVYGIERVGTGCGCIGANAVAVMDSGAVWMGRNGFYMFNGNVQPLPSDVSDYVFSDINATEYPKVHAAHNSLFREVWFFYCSSTSSEVDRYVIYNYTEGHWSIGSLSRTCWADAGVLSKPVAVSADGYVYEHESGWTANGAPITTDRYLTSGPVEVASGSNILYVRQVVPDERSNGDVRLRFTSKFTPEGDEYSFGPYTLSPYTDVRLSGRQMSVKIEGVSDDDWRVGTIRFEGTTGGQR